MTRGIKKRGSIWHICYSLGNGETKRESSRSKKFKDAEDLLIERKKAVKEGKEPESVKRIPNYTFSQLAEEYLKWAERQRSFRSKRGFIIQLVEAFGNIPLKHFTVKLMEQFQTDRINRGNKPATINRLIATLKHCIHKGYQWEMLPEETLKRVRQVKLLLENNRRLRYLSKEECDILINACSGPYLRAIVVTALNTGMRKTEILSLKWENVDLKHGFILLDKTKNGERREIPINDTLREIFQGISRRIDIPYVFFDQKEGKPFKEIKKSFNTALRKAGIRDFHFHDLRHTFASHLVMNGVDLTTVRELLGHKTLTMTLRYAHLAPSHKVKAMDILDSALNQKRTAQKLHNLKESYSAQQN